MFKAGEVDLDAATGAANRGAFDEGEDAGDPEVIEVEAGVPEGVGAPEGAGDAGRP